MIALTFCRKCGSILSHVSPELKRCPACYTEYRLRRGPTGRGRDAWVEVKDSEGGRG